VSRMAVKKISTALMNLSQLLPYLNMSAAALDVLRGPQVCP
jgi:hypothetical protein